AQQERHGTLRSRTGHENTVRIHHRQNRRKHSRSLLRETGEPVMAEALHAARNASFALSAEEVAQFERNGYLGPIKLYEPDEMRERWIQIQRQLRDRSHAIYQGSEVESSSIGNYDRHLDIDLLSEHIIQPGIVDRLVGLLGPNLLCWRSEFFP